MLKPGGRFAISDIVLTRELPESIQKNITAWAGCIAGALLEREYQEKLLVVGFTDIEIIRTRIYDVSDEQATVFFPGLTEVERQELRGALISAFIRAKKPNDMLVEDNEYTIRTALETDLPIIDKLLTENGLTTSGVRENLANFLVADYQGVIGVIGIEFAGNGAMLRSMAISKELRKRGIASALVERSLGISRQLGVTEAYILTNTAEKFVSRWGFYRIQRSEIPKEIISSSALSNLCPSTSICMKLDL